MEIAVADMADDRRQQMKPFQIGFGLGDAIGKPRDRHADVGCKHARAGPQCLDRPIGVMPRLPELGAVLGPRGPGEIAAAALLGDLAEIPGLLGNFGLAAVKFKQQKRRLRQRQF